MKNNVLNFITVLNKVKSIVKGFCNGIEERGRIASINQGSDGDYLFVEVAYEKYDDEMSYNLMIPYDLLEAADNDQAVNAFIKQEVKTYIFKFG